MIFSRDYTLRKSRHILKQVYSWYKKKGQELPPPALVSLEKEMGQLDAALLNKDRTSAGTLAKKLETFANQHCKKTILQNIIELFSALIFALVIAVIIRQMWFEPYEIPTGSMRPTFREQDHLTVTKTAFGINMPLATDHFYFDKDLIQRTSIFIFSGDKIPVLNSDSTYFGLFPYKKRYIKRCMGKPGDSFYFYGGQIYGVDKQGNELTELRNSPWMKPLEHVPFLSFDGEMSQNSNNSIIIKQMNVPVGKLSFNSQGQSVGEVFDGKNWIADLPLAQAAPHTAIKTYSDILGIRNYAVARLLNHEEIKKLSVDTKDSAEGVLYLQLHHTPSLSFPKPIVQKGYIGIPAYSTIIPLQQHHLDTLMDNLYTARFVVENGQARRYSDDRHLHSSPGPKFNVADGTYEFYQGKAFSIHWGGIAKDLPKDNPLYSRSPENIQKLFNFGMEMSLLFSPSPYNQTLFPHRYAYFRDGDLWLMGAKFIDKSDPSLIAFLKNEKSRQEKSTPQKPYIAFQDYGPPLKDGKIDTDFIRTFGMTIPEGRYLALGDNHAMSSDSRVFGFVPQDNLQGAPSFIFWPPGNRFGFVDAQKPYPFLNLPRLIVWGIAALIFFAWWLYYRHMIKTPIYSKRQFNYKV